MICFGHSVYAEDADQVATKNIETVKTYLIVDGEKVYFDYGKAM